MRSPARRSCSSSWRARSLLVAGLASLLLRGRRKEEKPDIPAGMSPGPSDADLETPLLQKLQGWGVILVAFFVIWIPLYWLQEPKANEKAEKNLLTDSIERGSKEVQLFTEDNQLGVGCVRCHGPELHGGVIQAQGVYGYPPNLTTVCGGPFVTPPHSQITSVDDIYTVIEEGRGDMPSWSIKFAGALDDQQITDLVNYLVHISSKNVPFNENVCLNPAAAAAAATPGAPAPTTAPSGSAGASASGSASAGGSASASASPTASASGSSG